MVIANALKYAEKGLESFSDEAANEAKIILAFLLGIEPSALSFSNKEVDPKELDKIINRRKKGEPLQYILGKWWFYEGEFYVGKGVLIPRQDTETLVDTALEFMDVKDNLEVADLCAGTGAIGISIALKRPNAKVTAVEKYSKAFSFLEKNIELNKCENVKPVKADVLKRSFGLYDIIASNPPYITRLDMRSLSKEVKREPKTALFGGEEGLHFYKTITKVWKPSLKKGGKLIFEIGIGQAEAVEEILKNEGFVDITVIKDLGGVQRVIFGTLN